MKKRFIVTSFSRYALLALLNKARRIIACLSGNVNFSTPTPSLEDVTAGADAFDAALALPNSKEATARRAQCRGKLTDLLNDLAEYVQEASKGDVTVMLSSGFDINKVRSKVGPLQQPVNFKVVAKTGQCVKARVKAVYGACSYSFEYALVADKEQGNWQTCLSSKSFTTISGLQKGAEYAFRVAAIGADAVLTYSDVVTSVIL